MQITLCFLHNVICIKHLSEKVRNEIVEKFGMRCRYG